MESYIVRIYRQEQRKSEKMTGVVIQVGGNEEYVFSNIFELHHILTNKRNAEKFSAHRHDSKPFA